jgi:hypothetical protein
VSWKVADQPPSGTNWQPNCWSACTAALDEPAPPHIFHTCGSPSLPHMRSAVDHVFERR